MVVIVFSLVFSATSVQAEFTVFEGNRNLSNDPVTSDFPQMSYSGSHIYVVWNSLSSDDNDVYFTSSSNYGDTFVDPLNLSSNRGASDYPQIISEENDVYVAWIDNEPGNDEIFFRASNNNGLSFEETINLSMNEGQSRFPIYEDHTSGVQANSQIASVGNQVYVIWQDSSTGNGDIYFRRSIDAGATFSEIVNLSNNTEASEYPLILATGNKVYVIWQDKTGGNSEILLRRSLNNGASFEETVNVSLTPGSSWRPKLSLFGDSLHVIWLDYTLGKTNLYYKNSLDSGATFSEAVVLTDAITSAGHHQIVASSDNKVYVIWRDGPNPVKEMYFRASNDDGSSFGETINLSNNDVDSAWGQISANGENVYVEWRDTPPGNKEVYFRESHDGGETFSQIVNLSDNPGTTGIPLLQAYGDGLYVLWRDVISGNYEIIFRHGIIANADMEPPDVTITSPSGNELVSSSVFPVTVDIYGTSYDSLAGVQKVEIKVNDAATLALLKGYAPVTPGSGGDYSLWTHQLTFGSEGSYRVTARGTDNAGNQSWYTVFIDIVSEETAADTTPPSISITSPSSEDTIVTTEIVNLVGVAGDGGGSGVGKVELKVTDPDTLELLQQYAIATSDDDWSTWTHKLTFDQEGSYRITARATDGPGNQGWYSVIINISLA